MKTLFPVAAMFIFILLGGNIVHAQHFQIPPDSITSCKDGVPMFIEGGSDKTKKLRNKVLSHAGIYDTAGITIFISTAVIYHFRQGDTIPSNAELIPLGKDSLLCFKGEPILMIDHLLSKCVDIDKTLQYYGYGAGIYYIQFQQNGKPVDTSHLKYATPLGKKADMHLKYAN